MDAFLAFCSSSKQCYCIVSFLFFYFYFFFSFPPLSILNSKILHKIVRKAEVKKHPCYFFQLKGIINVTNSFSLCISFLLTPPNEHRYLIYSLLSGFKVIVCSSCSGSDIQPVSHVHPLWDLPRRISAFLYVFEENLPLIFT